MATSSLDLPKFRQLLEKMRDDLQAELDRLQEESANVDQAEGYGVKNHPAEDASELFLRERNLAVSSDLRAELADANHALERIEAGTYGSCEECGEPINPERLEARPAATFCIRHQRERERTENTNG
jgi:RNA polymerase-binding protein DksA